MIGTASLEDSGQPAAQKTLGSLFAGIGGFDLGFERAGWRTAWQVELSERNRAVLADRLPGAIQLPDVRSPQCRELPRVDCIAFGSPCTDISNMGACRIHGTRGLEGAQSRLFFDALAVVDALQPAWLVFENVAALLHSNHGRDLERVVSEFARRIYLGFDY